MVSAAAIGGGRLKKSGAAFALGAAVFILAWASIAFARKTDGVASIWPVNAVILASIVNAGGKHWFSNLFSAFVGNIAGDCAANFDLYAAVILSCINQIEVIICALALIRVLGKDIDLTRPSHLYVFLVLTGLIAPGVSATMASLMLGPRDPALVPSYWLGWVATDGLGMVVLAPALLAITPATLSALRASLTDWNWVAPLLLLSGGLAIVFLLPRLPMLFLVSPVLVIITLRLGLPGGAIALLFTATVSLVVSLAGYGPVTLIQGGLAHRLLLLQLFLAVMSLSVLPLAAALKERDRLERRLRASGVSLQRGNRELEHRVARGTTELGTANQRLNLIVARQATDQQLLARVQEQYRVSFESDPVGKMQIDTATNRIIRANRALSDMLGYQPAKLVGQRAWDLIWPEDQAEDRTEYARLLMGYRGAFAREKRFTCSNGAPVWTRVSANVVSFPDSSQPDIIVAVVEDIDEQYKNREHLLQSRRQLEQVVVERTAALDQRDLLLREVYHRVKNNLQVVDTMLILQARQFNDPLVKKSIKSLRGRVQALGLVHQQLMGSQNLRTFDIAPFLQELAANIVEGGAERHITLTVSASPMQVGLDFAIPLALLATELVTNALKHAFPDSDGRIDVSLAPGEQGALIFTVSDDGQGLKSRPGPSTGFKAGLGQDIITSLVAQLKGAMVVRSESGMRFEVTMPMPVLQ